MGHQVGIGDHVIAVVDPLATEKVDRSPHIVGRSDLSGVRRPVQTMLGCRSERVAIVLGGENPISLKSRPTPMIWGWGWAATISTNSTARAGRSEHYRPGEEEKLREALGSI